MHMKPTAVLFIMLIINILPYVLSDFTIQPIYYWFMLMVWVVCFYSVLKNQNVDITVRNLFLWVEKKMLQFIDNGYLFSPMFWYQCCVNILMLLVLSCIFMFFNIWLCSILFMPFLLSLLPVNKMWRYIWFCALLILMVWLILKNVWIENSKMVRYVYFRWCSLCRQSNFYKKWYFFIIRLCILMEVCTMLYLTWWFIIEVFI